MSAVVSGEGTAAASALADGRPAAGKPEPLTATMRRGSSATPRNCPPPSGSGHPSRTPRSWTTSRSVASSTPLSTAPASPRPSGRPSPTESSTASPTFRSPPPATRSPTGTPAQRPYPHPPPDSNHTRDMLRWSVQQPARNDDSNPRRRFGGPYLRKTGAAASDASRSTSTAPKPPTGTRKGTASRAIAANRSPAPSMALARPTRMVRRSSTECIRRLDRPAV